jgi:prepilin-type N-terminal cleavage/methylation domain-containing protein
LKFNSLRFKFKNLMLDDMNRRGFTIVELIVVIAVMGILLILAVINLDSAQANGRDSERKTDIEAISAHLEVYYQSGTDGSTTLGDYPSTVLASSGAAYMTQTLRDINTNSLMAPGIADPTQTFIPATNNTQTTAGVTPQPTINQYVYQPLQSDGTLCTLEAQECHKYNLYYRLEADNLVYMATGKNQ